MDSRGSQAMISDYWVHISNQFNGATRISDEELHRHIVDTMLASCFNCDEHRPLIRDKLMEAMPLFHAHVRNTTLKRKIKVVKEIASQVKYEIGQR
jgi:hypothetical protein